MNTEHCLLTPVRYEIEYYAPAVAGDKVEVFSRVVAVGETQLTWAHEIRRGEERLVEARATICLQEEDGVPVLLPEALLQALSR